jgi:hypothetical protein
MGSFYLPSEDVWMAMGSHLGSLLELKKDQDAKDREKRQCNVAWSSPLQAVE